jgi:hypothetical protein
MRSGIEGRYRASVDGSYRVHGSRDQTRDRAFRDSALYGDSSSLGTSNRLPCDIEYDEGPLDFCDLGIACREANADASYGLRGLWFKVALAIVVVAAMALGGVAAVAHSQFKDRERLRQADGATFRANGRSLHLSLQTVWSRLKGEPTYVIRLPDDKFSSEDMLAYGQAFPESVVILQAATGGKTDVSAAD